MAAEYVKKRKWRFVLIPSGKEKALGTDREEARVIYRMSPGQESGRL